MKRDMFTKEERLFMISMATEPEETRTFYGWFGCISPETKEVRLNIVKDIIKELE